VRIFIYPADPAVRALERGVGLRAHEAYLRGVWRSFAPFACSDPAEADFFFPPLNLITFQFAGVAMPDVAPPDPYELLERLPYLDRGRHLLLATGDFGQRDRSPYDLGGQPGRAYPQLYSWLDRRFQLLAFESTASLAAGDVAMLPYVQAPRESWWRRRWPGPRDLLYSFAGSLVHPQLPPDHIRGGPMLAIAGAGEDHFVGSVAEASDRYGWAGTDRNILRRSVFALCPAGFGRWTFRLAQAVYYGAIPVVVSDGYIKPHARALDWNRFSLSVPEAQLASIPELLRAMPSSEVEALALGVREHREQMVERGALALLHAELEELAVAGDG
jgi:Exostosin family